MTTDDLPMVLKARNHPTTRAAMYTSGIITEAAHRSWWQAVSADGTRRDFIAEDDSGPIGAVNFTNLDQEHGRSDWAFYSFHHDRKGIGSAMEKAALEYVFETLGIQRLSCTVLAFNQAVIRLHRKHGFRIEGIQRKAHLAADGIYHDIYCLALLKSEYQASKESTWVGKEFSHPFTITNGDIDAFAELSRDRNPVHFGEGRIAHGMLTAGGISALLGTAFPGALYLSQNMTFKTKVLPCEQLTAKAKVLTQIGRRLILETTVINQVGLTVIAGECEVLLP